jgi:hypothetical protein
VRALSRTQSLRCATATQAGLRRSWVWCSSVVAVTGFGVRGMSVPIDQSRRRGSSFEAKRSSRNRCHHLLKTFYCGVGGWRERQLPDATLIVTAATGHTYATTPGCVQLFPTLCQPTATLWPPGEEPTVPPSDGRAVMMPKRRSTRAENPSRRIEADANSTTTTSPNATNRHPSKWPRRPA